MSDIEELLEKQLMDQEFAKVWEDTEHEYQIKRKQIIAKIEQKITQKELVEKSEII
ncbi:MAG: hypothetical protein J5959_21095 [Butyrivibrio sp.]|nr:hypothetical protein [Butyrivibrio sp.]MBP3274080.1 hypothetical protein [Butyrivibrio sp.]